MYEEQWRTDAREVLAIIMLTPNTTDNRVSTSRILIRPLLTYTFRCNLTTLTGTALFLNFITSVFCHLPKSLSVALNSSNDWMTAYSCQVTLISIFSTVWCYQTELNTILKQTISDYLNYNVSVFVWIRFTEWLLFHIIYLWNVDG